MGHGGCFLLRPGWEAAMLSCTYNGWDDAPEDEREALDEYERSAVEYCVTAPPAWLPQRSDTSHPHESRRLFR
jgi:hypothetical protein